MNQPYRPTEEQRAVIEHAGHAFIRACPGAGKTRTLVERARAVMEDRADRRGVAFLSFTNAAVDEMEARLRRFGVLPPRLFPNFIGTFDGFLWQFVISPFGVEGCDQQVRLIADKPLWEVKPPFDGAQALMLKHFDRETGKVIAEKTREVGFSPRNGPGAWETMARNMIRTSRLKGWLDFEDLRHCVRQRLKQCDLAARIGAALAGRFREIIVDEAQDCNPADLGIVDWLKGSGIAIKLVCDPHQAIYGFRGGLTHQLDAYGDAFASEDQLSMRGNFRSTPAICAAINQLRPPSSRGRADVPLGELREDPTPIHILGYSGLGVPSTIGVRFQEEVDRLGIACPDAPVLAATWSSAGKAVGRNLIEPGTDRTLLLAQAVMAFHQAFAAGNRRDAIVRLHRATLLVHGHIGTLGDYSAHCDDAGHTNGRWRSEIIAIGRALEGRAGETADQWLDRARARLEPGLVVDKSIRQRLRSHQKLGDMLLATSTTTTPPRSFHSVKGLEFPAVCVVLTAKTAGGILDVLKGNSTDAIAVEEARKLYVGASRAQRLLVIAAPKSQVGALSALLDAGGAAHMTQAI